jgi:hypothetical protein
MIFKLTTALFCFIVPMFPALADTSTKDSSGAVVVDEGWQQTHDPAQVLKLMRAQEDLYEREQLLSAYAYTLDDLAAVSERINNQPNPPAVVGSIAMDQSLEPLNAQLLQNHQEEMRIVDLLDQVPDDVMMKALSLKLSADMNSMLDSLQQYCDQHQDDQDFCAPQQ